MIKLIQRENGFVLVMVVLMVFLMSILIAAILARTVNQSTMTEDSVSRTVAEQVLRGAYAAAYVNMSEGRPPQDYNETIQGRNFQVKFSKDAGGGLNSTDKITVNVVY